MASLVWFLISESSGKRAGTNMHDRSNESLSGLDSRHLGLADETLSVIAMCVSNPDRSPL